MSLISYARQGTRKNFAAVEGFGCLLSLWKAGPPNALSRAYEDVFGAGSNINGALPLATKQRAKGFSSPKRGNESGAVLAWAGIRRKLGETFHWSGSPGSGAGSGLSPSERSAI